MKEQKRNINYFVKRAYKAYFDMKLGHQNKSWAPHLACKTCVGSLHGWTKGKLKLNFAVPMVWRKPKNHFDDCYFCLNDIKGFNKNKKKGWQYPSLDSVIRTVANSDDRPVPVYTSLPELMEIDESPSPAPLVASSDDVSCSHFDEPSNGPQLFNQGELNDLVRDLCLSKEQSDHGIIFFFKLRRMSNWYRGISIAIVQEKNFQTCLRTVYKKRRTSDILLSLKKNMMT